MPGGPYPVKVRGRSDPVAYRAPRITSSATLNAPAGETIHYVLTATGLPVPTFGLVTAGGSGLTLTDNGDGTADLEGTAPAADDYTIAVVAYNEPVAGMILTDSQTIALTTSAPATPYNVPTDIDDTGSVDVSKKWQTFYNSRPAGFVIECPPTAVYLCDAGVTVTNKSGITLNGNGCEFKVATFLGTDIDGTLNVAGQIPALNRGNFTFRNCDSMVVSDLTVTGALALGNLDGDCAITDGLDVTTPNLQDARRVHPVTGTVFSFVRGTPDRIHRSSGSFTSDGFSDNQNRGKGLQVEGFSTNGDGRYVVRDATGAVTATDIQLATSNTVSNESPPGAPVTLYTGRTQGNTFSMVPRGTQVTPFPGNQYRVHRTSGSWVTEGWKIGMRARIVGFTATANVDTDISTICYVTALDLYFSPGRGKPVAEAAGNTVSIVGTEDLGAYLFDYETQHGFRFYGCHDVEIDNVTTEYPLGDGAGFLGIFGTSPRRCEDTNLHDSTFRHSGRQGIAPGVVRRFQVRRCTFFHVRRTAIDFEPNGDGWGWQDCHVLDNSFEGNRLSSINLLTVGDETDHMIIQGNTWQNVSQNHIRINVGHPGAPADVWILDNVDLTGFNDASIDVTGARRVVIRNNTLKAQTGRYLIDIDYSQHLNIGGNTATPGNEVDYGPNAIIGTPPSATPPAPLYP